MPHTQNYGQAPILPHYSRFTCEPYTKLGYTLPASVALTLSSRSMPIPTYDQFIEPILRFLSKHPEGVLAKLAHDAAADALGLQPEERAQMLTSGTQQVYKNRAGWAHDRLKRAGLSSSPKRGSWRLTAEGAAFVAQHPAPLTADVVQKLATDFIGVRLKPTAGTDEPITPLPVPSTPSAVVSPDDQLEGAIGSCPIAWCNSTARTG